MPPTTTLVLEKLADRKLQADQRQWMRYTNTPLDRKLLDPRDLNRFNIYT